MVEISKYSGLMGTFFRGSNSAIFHFPSQSDQLLKERICSPWSKFFALRIDSILEGFYYPEKQTEVITLYTSVRKNMAVYPFTLSKMVYIYYN